MIKNFDKIIYYTELLREFSKESAVNGSGSIADNNNNANA